MQESGTQPQIEPDIHHGGQPVSSVWPSREALSQQNRYDMSVLRLRRLAAELEASRESEAMGNRPLFEPHHRVEMEREMEDLKRQMRDIAAHWALTEHLNWRSPLSISNQSMSRAGLRLRRSLSRIRWPLKGNANAIASIPPETRRAWNEVADRWVPIHADESILSSR